MEQARNDSLIGDPFAWLVDRSAVQTAAQLGDRWKLRRRVCRPLDQPLPGERMDRASLEQRALDAMIEAQFDSSEQNAQDEEAVV